MATGVVFLGDGLGEGKKMRRETVFCKKVHSGEGNAGSLVKKKEQGGCGDRKVHKHGFIAV